MSETRSPTMRRSLENGSLLRDSRRTTGTRRSRHHIFRYRSFLFLLAGVAAIGGFVVQYRSVALPSTELNETRGLWSTTRTTNNRSTSSVDNKVALFYHVYTPLPKDWEGIKNARRIVTEQLDQLPDNVEVFYNSVGGSCNIPTEQATLLRHYESGFEDLTLQSVYDYCVEHPDKPVIFMHNEGSYARHRGGISDRWRQSLMRGLHGCRLDHGCNVCGLHVQALPTLHFPGNVWMAECSYVRQLVSPRDYSAMRNWTNERPTSLTHSMYEIDENTIGNGQLTWESWIGSHPTVRPCDVSDVVDKSVWWSRDIHPLGEWGMFPKHPWDQGLPGLNPRPVSNALMHRESRLTDWSLLPGCIVRWVTMYGELPPMDSWVWNSNAYPDNQFWKELVKQYGLRVVDLLSPDKESQLKTIPDLPATDHIARTKLRRDDSWADLLKEYSSAVTSILNPLATDPSSSVAAPAGHRAANVALFYNVFVPPDEAGAANAIRIVEEQIAQINAAPTFSAKYRGAELFYNTIGQDTNATKVAMTRACTNMKCEHMRHYGEGFEDVTLNAVYDYCHANMASSVLYFHSKGSFHNREDTNEHWRRHLTTAVSREECLNPPDESCNVCGLQYFPIWSSFFPGNFFVAKCSYVRRLKRPSEFIQKMALVVDDVQRLQDPELFTMNLYNPADEGAFGLDRYSSELWIGSHPSIVPCDLSWTNDFSHWTQDARNVSNEVQFAMAPRADINGPWFRMWKRIRTLKDRRSRLHDYFLLSGFLFRWHNIYGELPPEDSWVWRWYPDGEKWRSKAAPYIREHGLSNSTLRGMFELVEAKWKDS